MDIDRIGTGRHIVLGLSGGPDSVFLLHVLLEKAEERHLTICPVHVNHQIRPGDAEADQRFVEALCEKHGLPLRTVTFNCEAMAKEQGISSEEAGRRMRYRAFREEARRLEEAGTDPAEIAIVTAHHADDQVETILLRILRGTGTDGLAGIEPERRMPEGWRLVRPLLGVWKTEILNWLEARKISYCIDETNSRPVYTRNRIRLELIPYLEQFNPRVKEAVLRLGRAAAEDREMLAPMVEIGLDLHTEERSMDEICLDEDVRTVAPGMLRRLVAEALGRLGLEENISAVHYEAVRRLAESDSPSGSVDLPEGYRVRREYGRLVISRPGERQESLLRMRKDWFPVDEFHGELEETLEKGRYAVFDYDRMQEALGEDFDRSLRIRTRKPGDYLTIRCGRKKIQDVFVDDKVPKEMRDHIQMICIGREVLFIPQQKGIRRARYSARFPETEQTRDVLAVWIRRKK